MLSKDGILSLKNVSEQSTMSGRINWKYFVVLRRRSLSQFSEKIQKLKVIFEDVSVWLNQAIYGMKSQHSSTVPNAHLVLLFQRICKLLYYRIKPIFVFDGGVPELKKKTMAARRSIRLSARNKAQRISENVLKKYLKSRAIGSMTGRKSKASQDVLNQPEPEKDLFELPPLPEGREIKSPSVEESFYESHHFQDTTDVNIDSDEFKNLPHEIQHEIIVEMHEKSKRHSRYQDINMPEESGDFSSFQLNHLLKRGRLTQRLGTIRKEMNDRRAGELVVHVADSGMSTNSIIQSQKIMSEDTGHYILIKRGTAPIDNLEEEEDKMAGGFFREEGNFHEAQVQQFDLKKLPKVPQNFVESSVSLALDAASSSASDSSDAEESQDVASKVWSSLSANDVNKQAQISIEDILKQNIAEQTTALSDAILRQQVTETENINSSDKTPLDNTSRPVELNELRMHIDSDDDSEKLCDDASENKAIDIKDPVVQDATEILSGHTKNVLNSSTTHTSTGSSSIQKLPEAGKISQLELSPEKKVSSFDTELDDLEDEINQKRRLIEKLLSDRHKSNITSSSSDANESGGNLLEEKTLGNEGQKNNSMQICTPSETSLQHENISGDSNDSRIAGSDRPTAGDDICNSVAHEVCETSQKTEIVQPVPNEFEGITYEELGEMQMKLDEDLDNLKEERSRQTRLAATVTDEMYKDSQELLQLFGIPFVISPMEAEAQCAILNSNNLCDGSITEDSDIILFGAKKVYKNIFNQKRFAELYQEEDVKCVLGLDRIKLITIALLTGSDYTEGVQGVGIVSAMEIINEFSGEGIEKLQNLKNWLDEKPIHHELQQSKVKSKLKNILLPPGFPSPQIFEAYLNPSVDDSTEAFSWGNPDLHSLRLFASEKLGWSKTKTDEILLPVLKRLNSKETQSKIDVYFPVQFKETRKIKSRRVKRIVNRLLNKESDEGDIEKQSAKKRKVKPKGHREKASCVDEKISGDVCIEKTSIIGQSDSSCLSATLENNQKNPRAGKNESCSDSTSDTSDEDQNYVPFNTKGRKPRTRGKARGRGGVASSRGSRDTGKRKHKTKKNF